MTDIYLWAFGSGGGSDRSVGTLGAHGPWNDLWSSDFLDLRPKTAFYLMFGSWFADWSQSDNILRSALASRELGLAAAWCGRPHLFFHHMGVGETIGHGIRLSQNNPGTLYQNQVQRQLRGIHVALLGDPTLRLHVIAPPTEARSETTGADVVLTWKPSPDKITGYHVYRAPGDGRFTRITGSPVGETRFVDPNRAREVGGYMVRAVALNTGPSGSYVNASQGAFASHRGTATAQQPPVVIAGETVWVDEALPNGAVGGAGRRHMGELPPTGRWVRLEVPASAVELEGKTVSGMGFNLFDGRATWDRAGKRTP